MIFSCLALLASTVFAIESEAQCQQYYDIVIETFDEVSGKCAEPAPPQETRESLARREQGNLAICMFRYHCITRLIGVTESAKDKAPPPLFDLSKIDARIATLINKTSCDGAQTFNQLFQNNERCKQVRPLVEFFCKPSTCVLNLTASLAASEWCNVQSSCNGIVDDYTRYCFTDSKNVTVWKQRVLADLPELSTCNITIDKLLKAINVIDRVGSSDGIDIPNPNFIPILPDAREGDGIRCNAGSHKCACLVAPKQGVRTASSGVGGICAASLECVNGLCERRAALSSDAQSLRATSNLALALIATQLLSLLSMSPFAAMRAT